MRFRLSPAFAGLGLLLLSGTAVQAQTVSNLPLQRGFYVEAKTACGNASNATLLLLTKTGRNFSRIEGTFAKIEKLGPTTYRVVTRDTERDTTRTVTATYEIPNNTSFRVRYDDGTADYRYCAQSTLPAPWRNNNIRDLIQ